MRHRHQRAGKPQLLLHAAGQFPRKPGGERTEAGERQQLLKPGLPLCTDKPLESGVKSHVFQDGQVFIEAESLGHIPNAVGQRIPIPDRIAAGHHDAALRRSHEPGQQSHQCRFARTIGADQTGQPPACDLRRDPIERQGRAERFHQIRDLDRDRCACVGRGVCGHDGPIGLYPAHCPQGQSRACLAEVPDRDC